MPNLDRNEFIALLKRLEGPDDRDVLSAARAIAERMKAADVSWSDLLAAPESVEAEEIEQSDPEGESGQTLAEEEAAEARAEIKGLLAKGRISDETRGEMNDLLADLAEGRFGRDDLRYVRALRARLHS